jgi:hypothetical protein
MKQIILENQIWAAFEGIGSGSLMPDEALMIVSDVISRNLEHFGVTQNTQNAFQICNLIGAQFFPDNSYSCYVLKGFHDGRFPEFSNECDEQYSLFRACATLASSFEIHAPTTLLKSAGKEMSLYIEQSGYLPVDVRE